MALTKSEKNDLLSMAKQLRIDIVDITATAGGAHIGGALSCLDIMTILYFKHMNVDPAKPEWEDRDRFVLSKGHAAVGYVPVLARKGFIEMSELKQFNKFGSAYGMHPDSLKVNGCDVSTGSLGHGLPIAVGLALGARVQNKDYKTYCIIGDGECNEGNIWEALMSISHYKLTNLVTFIDRNKLMIDGPTSEVMNIEPLADKVKAFGLNTLVINGHDFESLNEAIENAHNSSIPTVIICDTVKGKGVDFMEGNVPWHYGSIDAKLKVKALKSIEKMYEGMVK